MPSTTPTFLKQEQLYEPHFYATYSSYKCLYGWQRDQKVKDQTNDIVSHVFFKKSL